MSMAYLDVEPKFQYNFRFERLPGPLNGGHFDIFSKYFRYVHFDIRYGKIVKNYPRKSYFDPDDVSDDVTVRLWTLPSIFMFILLPCTFQLWCNISNAMHYHMALSIGYMKNFSLRIYLQNWPRYRHSKCQCCLLHSAINLARIPKLNTIGDQDLGDVSWKFQRNRPSSFWDTALLSLSSAMSAQRGLLTHLCFRGTNIVLTAKRSYSRTLQRLQTIFCDFWNLLQVLLRPKNV